MRLSSKRYFRNTLKVYIDPGIYLLVPVLLLTIPVKVLFSWFAAAFIHELGHVLALMLLNGKIVRVHIGPGGAVIEGENLGNLKNVICTLAGPIFGVLPVFFIRSFPRVGLLSLILTAYNLLPFYPLDGGRLLRILSCEYRKFNIFRLIIENITLFSLIAAAVCFRTPLLILPLFIPLREKYLANRRKRGYNSATIKVR